ncbi:MAG TPA: site-specific DNA-methyltransferase [Cryomorphaceae bacterium]|nr:site-specific DNA-methyltransferase [Cryomorphaceae bacterium]
MITEWLGKTVDKDDLTRHDKWLCMMTPRLKLIKELMAPDGIIAVAIDDNEIFHLGSLMDEVFGPLNKLACAPWQAEPSGGKEKTRLRSGHEYVMIYHNGDISSLSQEERSTGKLDRQDKWGKYRKGRELRKWGGTSSREDRQGQWYPLKTPTGATVYPYKNDGSEGHWRWGKNQKMKAIIEEPEVAHWELSPYDEGVLVNGERERWVPFEKIRDAKKSVGWSTWLDSYGFNADATRTLKELFGKKIFDTPKPIQLVEWIISLHEDENALVLDSFSGSGSTAHAVLNLNYEDEGDRKFILVEMEPDIADITRERVHRVIQGEPKFGSKDQRIINGVGGTFSYFELGDPIEMESILHGENFPSYADLARYLFYTATGEEFDPNQLNEEENFIGSSKDYDAYLLYKPDVEYLKNTALTLERARKFAAKSGKKSLVFAPAKFVDTHTLLELRVDYCQLPFEIYKLKG